MATTAEHQENDFFEYQAAVARSLAELDLLSLDRLRQTSELLRRGVMGRTRTLSTKVNWKKEGF